MILSKNLQNVNVLIVDDNMADRMILRQALKTLGFRQIQEAEDGSLAQYKINNANIVGEDFKLLFVDLQMPRQNGMLLLERLRTHTKTSDMYIVMVTGSSDLEVVEMAMKKGVDDFLVKPISLDTLKQKIEQFIDKRPGRT